MARLYLFTTGSCKPKFSSGRKADRGSPALARIHAVESTLVLDDLRRGKAATAYIEDIVSLCDTKTTN